MIKMEKILLILFIQSRKNCLHSLSVLKFTARFRLRLRLRPDRSLYELPTSLFELGTPPFGLRPHKTTGQDDPTSRSFKTQSSRRMFVLINPINPVNPARPPAEHSRSLSAYGLHDWRSAITQTKLTGRSRRTGLTINITVR